MSGNKTPCLFCGATGVKLTLEHVYPQWLRRAMNIRGDITIRSGGNVVRVAPSLDMTVRDVCAECNHGWMHDLERAFRSFAIPMLHGFEQFLPQPQQRVCAVWAVKTWLLIERALNYSRGGETPIVPPTYFDYLRTHREPPPLTKVWIGAVDARADPESFISIVSTQWVATPPNPPDGIVGVFTIGCLLFFIYNPVQSSEDVPPQELGIRGLMARHLTQVWPHQVEEVRWPPEGVFTPADVLRLWPDGGIIRPGDAPSQAA